MTIDNQDRASRARRTISGYSGDGEPDPCSLCDFIADAYHAFGVEVVENALRMGRMHFDAELRGEP